MPSPRLAFLLAAALLVPLLTSSNAQAGGPPGMAEPSLPEVPTTRTVHYGYQTFLADALWIGAAAALSKSESGGTGDLLVLGYYGGGPAVHLLHHNRSAAAKSLGLRVLLPIAGALVGLAVAERSGGFEALADVLVGFVGGAVTAMVIDWTVLSKQSVEVPHVGTLSALRPGMKIGKRAVTVSIAGSF